MSWSGFGTGSRSFSSQPPEYLNHDRDQEYGLGTGRCDGDGFAVLGGV